IIIMRAAVLYKLGSPKFVSDFVVPTPANDQQVVVKVLTSTIKQLDRSKANGKHYLAYKEFPCTVGVDGVAQLDDGTLIYAMGITGMLAEKAVVTKNKWTVLDKGSDPQVAAALPNAVLGAAMALKERAQIKPNDVVLINGATGFTGKLAVQLARLYGASKVYATGRNETALKELKEELGADQVFKIDQPDDVLIDQFKQLHKTTPIDIVIDYLYSKPLELIITALSTSGAGHHRTRIVTVGEMAGPTINIKSATLRSTGIELMGSGFGSYPANGIELFINENINQLLKENREGRLKVPIFVSPLEDIESTWDKSTEEGRVVVQIS
ncbi:hypothetical protein SAMD00019534_048460, partial [Acytostelium subglobosum LB1]|uniref:hypothetical protein n=1 Tax=Acytostelium subglobosum LB1 TaxID=1410327 RepID=UPI00064503AE